MIYLAPNVYVLGYLSATKQLSGASEANAYKFIQSGTSRLHPQYSDSQELFFEIVTGSVYKSFYERAPKFFFLPPPPLSPTPPPSVYQVLSTHGTMIGLLNKAIVDLPIRLEENSKA